MINAEKLGFPLFVEMVLICILVNIAFPSKGVSQPCSISIEKPKHGSEIECPNAKYMVEGKVSDPSLHTIILIHPMATNKFWVQPQPTVQSNGSWFAYCYIGTLTEGIGEPFEIVALVMKTKKFKEGEQLPSPLPKVPDILCRSESVIVTRIK